MKRKSNKITTKQGALIFVALFAIFYILIYIVPTVSDIFTQTYIAEYGTLEVNREAECIIVRDEKVYKASSSGKVDRVVDSGQLMKAHSNIVSVGGSQMTSDAVGIVSYYYDGFESKLSSKNIDGIKQEFFQTFKDSKGVQKAASSSAQAGETVFKIIDSTRWYLICWMDAEGEEQFEVGNVVTVDFGDDNKVQMDIDSITKDGKKIKLVFSTNRIYEDYDKYRVVKCTIAVKSSTGIIINTDSICEKDGQQGVYVIDKYGNENFTPVQVYSVQGDKAVVAKNYFYDSKGYPVETIKNYDEILKKPN